MIKSPMGFHYTDFQTRQLLAICIDHSLPNAIVICDAIFWDLLTLASSCEFAIIRKNFLRW